jgi:hypothetical protein
MLLSPFGNLSHTSILYYWEMITLQYMKTVDKLQNVLNITSLLFAVLLVHHAMPHGYYLQR